jgi:hypothetical protein
MAFGLATATVKGGFWDVNAAQPLVSMSGESGNRRKVAQHISRKSMYGLREIVRTLDGAVAGSAASKTLARVQANSELGGKRTIETETLVSRNTTAQDVTDTKADLFSLSARTTKTAQANLNKNPLASPGLF